MVKQIDRTGGPPSGPKVNVGTTTCRPTAGSPTARDGQTDGEQTRKRVAMVKQSGQIEWSRQTAQHTWAGGDRIWSGGGGVQVDTPKPRGKSRIKEYW